MPNIGLSLKGQFKFDLYDADHNLISSSEFVDNFITNTGVLYPYYFAFADCFRYLSVGIGTGINSIINTGGANAETTGLQSPLTGSTYAYIGSRPTIITDISNYAAPGCGYTETISGINLFRQWTLPDNTGGLFSISQTLNEFMVTPGQPYVIGLDSSKLCTCDENDFGIGGTSQGNDCSTVAMYYTWVQGAYKGVQYRPRICDAVMAFARVVYPVNLVPNSSLNVTYRLSVNPTTGITFVSLSNNVGGSSDPNWTGILNSVSVITQPGIKLINDGTILQPPYTPNGSPRLQHFNYTGNYDYNFDYEYGESFIPPMGIPLEPSNLSVNTNQNIAYYVSSDNTQFLVGPSGVLINTGNYAPWQIGSGIITTQNSGLAPFLNNNSLIINQGGNYWTNNPNTFNIRTSQVNGRTTTDIFPLSGDITQPDNAPTATSYIAPFISEPLFQPLKIPVYNGYRTGQVTYSFDFQGYRGDTNLSVKSFVAGYIDAADPLALGNNGDDVNMIPFFDCIFSGTGKIFIPQIVTGYNGISNYANGTITGAYISGAGDQNYFYLLNGNGEKYPIFDTVLTWNVPCPQGVTGC